MKSLKAILTSLCLLLTFTSCAGGGTTAVSSGSEKPLSPAGQNDAESQTAQPAKLLYLGHASLRITTPEGRVIYIDPYAGKQYDAPADLILVTHDHFDHTQLDKIKRRADGCRVITYKEALVKGEHKTFDLGYVTVTAVEAGYNRNHNVKSCVGYLLTLSDGVKVYVSGDTSKTKQMPELSALHIDYAFFCCDGVYNMDLKEAAQCARLVGARHDIPYHVIPASGDKFFDRERAGQFDSPNLLVVEPGEEILLQNSEA